MQHETTHPLVTFFVFAYNQEDYIGEACKAALLQDYKPLEIIFSDDCSTDRTYEIMKIVAATYPGPHIIRLNRNPQNLGLIDHVNLSFQISKGELIIAAAGDDVSLPHRVSRIVEAYIASEKSALLIHSNVKKISINGNYCGELVPPVISRGMSLIDIATSMSLYIGASGAWNKRLFESFGPLSYKNAYEDSTLGFRAALTDSLLYINESLVNYRIGIGISENHYSLNMPSFLKRMKNEYKIQVDIFQQRKLDFKHIKNTKNGLKIVASLFRFNGLLYWIKKTQTLLKKTFHLI